jgi:electron transfer flavoprotein beta subunit
MAAKKKPVTEWSLADLGVDPATVGADAARVEIAAVTRNPERQAGRVVVDEGGSSVTEIVAFLAQA